MWYKFCIFLLCSGCTIHPLHELNPKFESEELKSLGGIYVDVIGGKNGQILRGYLQDLIRDLDIEGEHYKLSVTLSKHHVPYALADDGNAQRLKINLVTNVNLKTLDGDNVFSTSITGSSTRNTASTQGDVLLSMYDNANSYVLKNLAFRIVENLKVALKK